MKKGNRFRNILLISFAIIVVASAGIGEAWAYFTTYATAQGGYTIHLGYETEITEDYANGMKTIVIHNKEGSEPVYVRVLAFSGSTHPLIFSSDSNSWHQNEQDPLDPYWYYDEILYADEKTEALKISIENIPVTPEDEFEFNVVVVYESTPVRYDANDKPYADWDAKWDLGEWKGGVQK